MPRPYVSIQCHILEIIDFLQINVRFQKLPMWKTLLRLYYCDCIRAYLTESTATVFRGLSQGIYCDCIRAYLKESTATVLGAYLKESTATVLGAYLKDSTATVLRPTSLSIDGSLWSQDSRTWS
jgi:hypothetical protein